MNSLPTHHDLKRFPTQQDRDEIRDKYEGHVKSVIDAINDVIKPPQRKPKSKKVSQFLEKLYTQQNTQATILDSDD